MQQRFKYGWDWFGVDETGSRLLFDHESEAQAIINAMVRRMDFDPEDWRVMEYDPETDDGDDLDPKPPRPSAGSLIKTIWKYISFVLVFELILEIIGDK